jgi:hypothetical protein
MCTCIMWHACMKRTAVFVNYSLDVAYTVHLRMQLKKTKAKLWQYSIFIVIDLSVLYFLGPEHPVLQYHVLIIFILLH